MRFDTTKPFEVQRLKEYLTRNVGKKLDVKVVRQKRSLQSNAYYHLVLQYFGTQTSMKLEEVKELIRQLQTDIYKTEWINFGENKVMRSRSSADLNSKEMSDSIDRFRTWSAQQGIDLPAAEDKAFMEWATDEVARNSYI